MSELEEKPNLYFTEAAAEAQGGKGPCPRSAWGPQVHMTDSFSGDVSSVLVLSPVLSVRTHSQCQGCALHSSGFLEFSRALSSRPRNNIFNMSLHF